MNMKRAAILLLTLAAGCAISPAERSGNMMRQHGPVCEGLGFVQYSADWKQCVVQLDATQQAKNDAIFHSGMAILKAQQDERVRQDAIRAANRPRRTHCFQSGQNIDCTTY